MACFAMNDTIRNDTGTLGFGLGRTAEVVCGVRKPDGTYERMTYEFGPADMGWEREAGDYLTQCNSHRPGPHTLYPSPSR